MKHIAAKLVLSGLAILMAITPVPFEKWAWQRIALGIIGLGGMAVTKTGIDKESEEQRLADIYDHEQKQYEKELAQVERTLAIEAAQRQEAIRFDLDTQLATADYQRAFVTVMDAKHPGRLEAMIAQAQKQAELETQKRAYSAEGGLVGRTNEVIEVGAIGSKESAETLSSSTGSQDKGQRLLQRLRKSDMSILVVGSTGAGKSHTLSAYLEFLYQDFPDADVWVVSRKNDSFCGLREAGRVVRFNSLDPVDALDKLREIHAIFQERTEVLEEDRPKLSTIRLILEDWSSICLILKKNKIIWNEVQIILSDIVTVGRELNVALFILAQSAILESLGLVGDANLRTCLAIVAQGLESVNNKGEKQGDYNLIQLILKNAYIIPSDEDRKMLTNELSDLITESRQIKQPVFLCTGGEAFVGLLPKITKAVLPVEQQRKQATQGNLNSSVKQNDSVDIEAQKEQLDATFNKTYNPLDHFMQEASQEQLEEMIKSWREMADTSKSDVSDALIQKNISDTYQASEPLRGKGLRRIWDVSDFRKNLPDRQEEVMFRELDTFFQNVSRSPNRIIKEAWGLSNGNVYSAIGKPCFVYLVTKYGSEEHKSSPKFAKHISEYLASADDTNDE